MLPTADELDYEALGFQCGLEIHQQVAGSKLFCRCATDDESADDDRADFRFVRRLRPTQSELGDVDAAALAESRRHRLFEYRGFRAVSCLVEADEEPPHPASPDAVDTALTMALLLGSSPVDEVQWMRKTVIDGSNTSGFQRTGLLARGGRVDDVTIQTICLEEDSARRIQDEPDRVVWGLDRLGIPLVEIATDPTIRDGAHARAIAARLGALLRSTGRVKRGLGTIRQDLNVSIRGGRRVEIKGVQDLAAIPKVAAWEVRRHLRMLEVARILKERDVQPDALAYAPTDVTAVLRGTAAGFLQKNAQAGGIVLGQRLPGFHGLAGAAKKEDPRLGRELAAYARRDGGVHGILHGDELPGMGITADETARVRNHLGCRDLDSFVLVAEKAPTAERALRVVLQRAARALEGVLGEVRMAEADHTTTYLRPMPGAARMYPETDIPPSLVTPARLASLRARLPAPPEAQVARLQTRGLGMEEARQIVADGLVPVFDGLAEDGPPTLAARVLLAYLPELERRHPKVAGRLLGWAHQGLRAVAAGTFAKEGLPTVLEALAAGQAATLEEAARLRGLAGADLHDVEARARILVDERADFVRQRGAESLGPLMGLLMKEFRGRVDGKTLNDLLDREVRRVLAAPAPRP